MSDDSQIWQSILDEELKKFEAQYDWDGECDPEFLTFPDDALYCAFILKWG